MMHVVVGVSNSLCRLGIVSFIENEFGVVDVKQANSFDSLLDVVDNESNINLMILDMGLMDMNGLTGIATIHRRHPEIPIAALYDPCGSKYGGLEVIGAGARGYINQTMMPSAMLSALSSVAQGGVYLEASCIDEVESDSNREATEVDCLPRRQREVLELLAQGQSNKLIARNLGICEGTVKVHVSAIFRQLGVHNRTEACLALNQIQPKTADVIQLFSQKG